MYTPLELEFIVHYRIMDKESGPWDRVRIARLCNILKLTFEEFARYIRLKPGTLNSYIERRVFPEPLRLILDLVERSAHNTYLGKAHLKPLFPSYPDGRPANP